MQAQLPHTADDEGLGIVNREELLCALWLCADPTCPNSIGRSTSSEDSPYKHG